MKQRVFCCAAVAAMCVGAAPAPLDLSKVEPIDKGCTVHVEADGTAVMEVPPPAARNGSTMARCDYVGDLDMSASAGIEFDLKIDEPSAFSSLMICFASAHVGDADWKSGNVWNYSAVKKHLAESAGEDGWTHVTVHKSDLMQFMGRPKGFKLVTRIRLLFSERPEFARPVTCRLRNLRLLPAEDLATEVWYVAADVTLPEMKVPLASHSYRLRPREALRHAGFAVATVRESDFPEEVPASVKVVVLPENRFLPDRVRTVLEGFAARGGKIIFARGQVERWRKEMLKRGCGEDIAYRHGAVSVGEQAKFYEERIASWFPDVAAAAAKRLAAREKEGLAALAKLRKASKDFARFRRVFMYCHDPYGPRYRDEPWEPSVRFLADHGVTDLVVNFSWATTANYRSDVLSVTDDVAKKGDGLADCLAACRKHGVRLHAWRCCWRLGRLLPKGEVERLKAEDRLQRDAKGGVIADWLCPNHPANHRMHVEAMVELAKKGVAGIHYDYIRYGSVPSQSCFCGRCRAAFEKELGRTVADWPADVRNDPALRQAWGDFRCRSIGHGVREIAARVRKECPGVEISSSGAFDWQTDSAGRSVGGDWVLGRDWAAWARNGWVDFVMLMDYTAMQKAFRGTVTRQKATDVGKAFLVPVMGPSCWPDDVAANDACRVLELGSILAEVGFSDAGIYMFDTRAFGYLPLVMP